MQEKEAAETAYWLALCRADGLLDREDADDAIREADELTRILSRNCSQIKRTSWRGANGRQHAVRLSLRFCVFVFLHFCVLERLCLLNVTPFASV